MSLVVQVEIVSMKPVTNLSSWWFKARFSKRLTNLALIFRLRTYFKLIFVHSVKKEKSLILWNTECGYTKVIESFAGGSSFLNKMCWHHYENQWPIHLGMYFITLNSIALTSIYNIYLSPVLYQFYAFVVKSGEKSISPPNLFFLF